MRVSLRAYLAFGLLAAVGLSQCLTLAAPEGQVAVNSDPFHSIKKRALDTVVSMISGDFKARTLAWPAGLMPALAGITIIGAFKIASLFVASFFLLTSFFPSILGMAGITSPFLFRSIADGVGELKNMNYEVVARSLTAIPEKSFDALDIKGTECRARAICEMGDLMAEKFPSVAGWVRMVGDNFALGDKYTVAMLKGMKKLDCGITFSSCTSSPFKKWSTISSIFR